MTKHYSTVLAFLLSRQRKATESIPNNYNGYLHIPDTQRHGGPATVLANDTNNIQVYI